MPDSLYQATRDSITVSPSWFEQNRHSVGQLGHAAEEEGPFRHQHRRADFLPAQGAEAVREPRYRGSDVPLGRREPGKAALTLEVVELLPVELAALHGQRADQLVVSQRHVPGSGGLRDFRVVQLRGVALDVEDPAT